MSPGMAVIVASEGSRTGGVLSKYTFNLWIIDVVFMAPIEPEVSKPREDFYNTC